MKTLVLAFFVLISIPATAQRILIVDNTGIEAEGDHVFTDLQTAINESQPGDIFHIVPSPRSYGNISINNREDLTFIGIGYYADTQIPSVTYFSEIGEVTIVESNNLTFRGLFSNSQGSFEGFQIDPLGGSDEEEISNDIFIEECIIADFRTGNKANRVIITNSYIYSQLSMFGYNQSIRNSIIRDQSPTANRTYFGNNLITNFNSLGGDDAYFANNIFLYTGSSKPAENEGYSFVNNFFNKDIGHTIGNSHQDNIVAELQFNEIFEQDIPNNSTWGGRNDLTLKSTLLINAGNDGTDIGPTGGSSPHSNTLLSLPSIIELFTPTKVQEGQDFEVTIKARGN